MECVNDFTSEGQNFIVKGNGFKFDRVLHMHPNTHQDVKYFLNFILTWNKHSQCKLNTDNLHYLFQCKIFFKKYFLILSYLFYSKIFCQKIKYFQSTQST